MKNRKFLSLLLALSMILALVPSLAAAEPTGADEAIIAEQAEAALQEQIETEEAAQPETIAAEPIDEMAEIEAAEAGIELAAESASPKPTLDPKGEAVYIINANFRQHPATSSIFKGQSVPPKLLWVEFSNRIDHVADFDEASRTYTLDGKYYQLVVSRPQHGPDGPDATPHPAATMIPDNGIEGGVKEEFTDNETEHRYHGWQLGTDAMFDKDDTNEYQVGKYTVSLMRLYPTDDEKNNKEQLMHCANRDLVNEKSLDIVEVEYKLSTEDAAKGYKLICANEPEKKDQTSITELAMVGDWITIIDPSVDTSQVSDGTDDDKKKVIGYWKIVKDGEAAESAGAKVPAGDADGDENDNKITLEAVLTAPVDYSYEYQLDDDSNTAAFPTAPPEASEGPTPTPPAASYNQLLSASAEPKEVEYQPEATIEPLRLRVVNTGNQRSSISTNSSNDVFTVKTINVNTDDEAKKDYSSGGLDAGKSLFYIPTKADIDNGHSEWKNYAIVEITPKKGLSVGTHHGQIYSYNITSNYRVPQRYDIDITVSPKEVDIEPLSTTKPYGKELTAADITCNVYEKGGQLLESNKTAAELGVVIQSVGMGTEATVKGGPYEYSVGEGQSTGNYDVKLKAGCENGITVEKTTPKYNNVKASAINDGVKLSASKLSGFYVNPYSHQEVAGSLEWVDPDEDIPVGTTGTISKKYQFKPQDTDNYNTPEEASVSITVSGRRDSNLTLSSLEKTYNGSAQKPTVKWDRLGVIDIGRNVKVVYKKLEDGADRNFTEDEQFTEEGGYTEQMPKDAGVYKVHAETLANNDQYFAPDSVNAIMTINPYKLELTFKSGSVKTKMYDGTTTAEIDPSKVGFKKKVGASDEVSVKASAFTATFSSAYVEPYSPKDVTVNVSGENALEGKDAANYTLTTAKLSTTGYISIQRPIKLELKKTIEKHYGETYTFTTNDYQAAATQPIPGGLVSGESVENVRATLKAEKNGVDGTTANAQVGEYPVTASAPKTDNYNYEITGGTLGNLSVIKTQPQEISVNADNGKAGNTLKSLEDEHFTGTFQNPYSHEDVKGKIEWVDPDEVLRTDKSKYEYRFTPEDLTNYEVITGTVTVVVTDKEAAKIAEWNVPSAAPYDGQPRIATIRAESPNAQTAVEYKKTDIELHDTSAEDGWTPVPPVNAGTYLVRGTIFAFDDFAENVANGTIEILQAEPKGSVTASNVDKGANLGDSQLTATFTGVDNAPLAGAATWNTQNGVAPNAIPVAPDTEYEWIFVPEDKNYKPVTGKTTIGFNVDTRKADAVIYNLPANYDELGDYAYVNVDKSIFKVGDAVRFYGDQAMTNPESERFVITDEMNGWTLVNIDDDALNTQKGTLYLNIEGSTSVAPIEYKAEIGFMLDPAQLYLKPSTTDNITVKTSDETYVIENIKWTLDQSDIAEVNGSTSGASITGVKSGSSRLTAEAEFKHPDVNMSDKMVTVTNVALVNVTEDDPPKYTYTTNDATDITYTGATLNGRVDITLPEGSTITPVASCKFELWEDGSVEKTVYDSGLILRESGDYNVAVDGLKPDTTYCYRAFGAQSDTEAEVKTFTTGSAPVPTATPTAEPETSAAPNVIPVTDVQSSGDTTAEPVDLTAGTGYNDEVKAVFGDNFAEVADNKITGIDNESVVTAPVTIKEKGDYEFEVLAVGDKDNNVITLTPVLAAEGFTNQKLDAEASVGKAGGEDVYLYTYIAKDLDPGNYTVTYKSATQAEASDYIAMAIVKLTEEPAPTPGETDTPTATPGTTTPTATPGTTDTPTPTPGTTDTPTATPGTTDTPTATPGTTTAPTATPGTTDNPTATPGTTTEPAPTSTPTSGPEETLVPTIEPDKSAVYGEKPVMDKENIRASIINNTGGEVWFIAAAYRDEAMIDVKIEKVPVGTNPVNTKFNADYSADSAVDVMFYLWDAKTLKPYTAPIPGK